jgi:GNAT superfamily N-acetyltransferase
MSANLCLREATLADTAILVQHRRLMMEEIRTLQGREFDPAAMAAMGERYAPYLERHLADDSVQAWVVEAEGQVVASGVVTLVDWPPGPGARDSRYAYLHGIYTAPDYRRRGLARQVVNAAVEYCRALGLRRLFLHASDAGQPLYAGLGFEMVENEMVLDLAQAQTPTNTEVIDRLYGMDARAKLLEEHEEEHRQEIGGDSQHEG